MFGFRSPTPRPGRPLLARMIAIPAESVARLSRSRVGSGMASVEAAGTPLPYSTLRRSWVVRLTSVGTSNQFAQYGWQAVVGDPASPGAYLDQDGWAGTLDSDPAFEDNGNGLLRVGERVEVSREYASGRVRFQFDQCG